MQGRDKLLGEATRLAGGLASAVGDIGKQAGEAVRTRVDHMAHEMDLVPREEFERLEAMVTALREEQETLKTRIEELSKKCPSSFR